MEAEALALLGRSGAALRQLGMWRPPASGPAGPRLLGAVFIVATCAIVAVASAVQLVVDTPDDPETLRDVFFQCTNCSSWTIRIVLFMQQRARLGHLVMTLLHTRKRYAELVPGIRSSYDRGAVIIFFAWQVLPFTSISLWALGPVTDTPKLVTAGNSSVVERREPMVLWLPLDTQQSPTYEIVFVLQVVGVVAMSEVSILLDIFFVCLMIHVTAEIAVLNKNVSSIHLLGLNGERSQLLELVDMTAGGELCVSELEQGMSESTYVVLLVNALTICLQAFGFVEVGT
ncbi:uncharacterized protein LOC126195723 [Schistocerca nitens]|uniref:uncharacterized protein LOC126195723 n=1 Tax=Schistocerca nitens TaxID=7011 RepID=UPI0021195D7F|nr:uncharacterized protein LOC126195723 [Schistocerca nitens]